MPADRCVHQEAARDTPKCKPACGKKTCPWCIVSRVKAREFLLLDVVEAAREFVNDTDRLDPGEEVATHLLADLRAALAKLDEGKTKEQPAVDPRQKVMFDE